MQHAEGKFQSGICLPASCSAAKVKEITTTILGESKLVFIDADCQTNDEVLFTIYDYFVMWELKLFKNLKLQIFLLRSFLSLLLIFVVASTVYDFVRKKADDDDNITDILTSFSIRKNWKNITKTSPKSSKSIDCINGLKVLSAFWIVSGHREGMFSKHMTDYIDLDFAEEEVLDVIGLHQYAVDTFMVISAYLLTLSCLKSFER